MKKMSLLCIALVSLSVFGAEPSTPLDILEDRNILELENVLLQEMSSVSKIKIGSNLNLTTLSQQDETRLTSKFDSIQEMQETLALCRKQGVLASNKQTSEDMTTIAFSCRKTGQEIISAEVLIQEDGSGSKILSYQEMVLVERPMTPAQMTNLALNYDMNQLDSQSSVSPGVRTLFTLAKVGVPVYLSFKFAKVLSPVRKDWQKHYIAGAMISGLTVLTSEGIIRAIAKRNGYHPTNFQMNIITSFAGLIGSMAAGISKELYDKYSGKGHPEVADAVYTAAGGASVAFTVIIPIEAIFRTRRAQMKVIR